MQKSVNFYVFAKPIYFSFAKYIVVGGTQSCLAKCKVHSIKLQSRALGPIPPTFFETLHFALFTLPILKSANLLRSTNIFNHFAKNCKFLCIFKVIIFISEP
jgi:hypothetical protein